MIRTMNPLQIALAGLCGILAILLGYQLSVAPSSPEIPVLQWSPPRATAPVAPPAPSVLESYAAINARPLFNPARTPLVASEQKNAAAPPPPPDVSLVGVIIEGTTRMALVRTPASPLETSVT